MLSNFYNSCHMMLILKNSKYSMHENNATSIQINKSGPGYNKIFAQNYNTWYRLDFGGKEGGYSRINGLACIHSYNPSSNSFYVFSEVFSEDSSSQASKTKDNVVKFMKKEIENLKGLLNAQ